MHLIRTAPVLLVVLACINHTADAGTATTTAPPPPVAPPIPEEPAPPPVHRATGGLPAMQLDSTCFSSPRREMPAGAPAPTPQRSAAPAKSTGGAGYGGSAGDSLGTLGGAANHAPASSSAAAPPAPAGPAPDATPMPAVPPKAKDERKRDLSVADVAEAEEPAFRGAVPPEAQAAVDWGGVVHLSNDDALSLASPQRLLWALDKQQGFSTSQIRPHELLNYFSFDSTTPRGGTTFGVDASATQSGDTLSLALAIEGAKPPRPPLDLTVLVDRSGSMSAEGRMSYTQRALRLAADQLQTGDLVDIVLFDDRVCTPIRNFVVGRDRPDDLRRVIDQMAPRGSTDLDLGLKEAYRVATDRPALPDRAGRVMVFTDAILNTGDVRPESVTEIGRHLDARGIRLTGVGVGSDFRDDVLNKLTEKGKGAYIFLGSEKVVDRFFTTGFDALVHTIAEDVRFALDLPDSLGMKRFYGEEMSTNPDEVQPVSFQAGARQLFLQELTVRSGRVSPNDPIVLDMRWTDPASGRPREQRFTTTVGQALGADAHNVHKGLALMRWSDVLTDHAMGNETCGASFTAYRRAIAPLQGDAEIAYTSELLGRWCRMDEPVAAWTAPAFTKVRFQSDVPISEAELVCGGQRWSVPLTTSENIARFPASAGACALTLQGTVPMTTPVQVPGEGTELSCTIRGGRMSCS